MEARIKDGGCDADVVGLAETHTEDGENIVSFLDTWGWKGSVAPARPGKRAQAAGGAAICARRHLACHTYRHLCAAADQQAGLGRVDGTLCRGGGAIDFFDFAPMGIQLRGGKELILVALYLTDGDGVGGNNAVKLVHLAAFLSLTRAP